LRDVAGIAGVMSHPSDPDAFVVEFFDLRDANRFVESFLQTVSPIGCSESSTIITMATTSTDAMQLSEPTPAFAPAFVVPTDFVAKSNKGASVSSAKENVSVLVMGMPNQMLSKPLIEAMLQQAGLEETISKYEMSKGDPCGELLLHFSNHLLAAQCVRHFEGCQWDTSGTAVTTRILTSVDTVHCYNLDHKRREEATLPLLDGMAKYEKFEEKLLCKYTSGAESTEAESVESDEDDFIEAMA